jgi:hypothetical protein
VPIIYCISIIGHFFRFVNRHARGSLVPITMSYRHFRSFDNQPQRPAGQLVLRELPFLSRKGKGVFYYTILDEGKRSFILDKYGNKLPVYEGRSEIVASMQQALLPALC